MVGVQGRGKVEKRLFPESLWKAVKNRYVPFTFGTYPKKLSLMSPRIQFRVYTLLVILPFFGNHFPITGNPTATLSISRWLTVGPFPNPKTSQPQHDGATRAGFEIDYLGGETKAILIPGDVYSYQPVEKLVRTLRLWIPAFTGRTVSEEIC